MTTLTIGQLAAYAGTTVRAVRHYHAVGLLPEPARDHSGYRRYDGTALIELIRIRTLAEAGVPLARVQELLTADEAEFARAIADIDARLREEIREREHHRARIARLGAGDHVVLPVEVVELLAELRALGVDERIVRVERDGWIPVVVRSPERVAGWVARKREQLADPRVVEFYRVLGRALDGADDPDELARLADTLADLFAELAEHDEHDPEIAQPLTTVMDALALDTVPPARRLVDLLAARGWTGWTSLERQEPR